jgi:hypothetical protein
MSPQTKKNKKVEHEHIATDRNTIFSSNTLSPNDYNIIIKCNCGKIITLHVQTITPIIPKKKK